MLAHGFTVEMMTALAREGLVTVTAGRMVAGGRNREVAVPTNHRDGATGAQRHRVMTPPKKRMYDFRIVEWQVFTPEE